MEQVSRMATEVNKLIGSTLLSGSGVWLPEIGSLHISENQHGIKRIDFCATEQGKTLIEIIMGRANCSKEQASEIYKRWREEIATPELVEIAGVGSLSLGKFIMAESFAKQLNPPIKEEKEQQPTMNTKKEKNYTAIIVIVAAILIGVGGYFAYNAISKSKAEKAAIEAAAQKEAAEQQRVADSIALANVEAKQAADAAVQVATPRYRVVYGVYKLRSNVDVALRHIDKEFGAGSAHEYPFRDRTLVSMFESNDRKECQRFLMTNYDTYPDTWIYDSEQ